MARNNQTSHDVRLWLLVVMCATLISLPSASAEPADAPSLPPNQLLLNDQPELFKLAGQAAGADAKIISDHGPGFERAWGIEVRHQPDAEFQVQLVSPITSKLNPG